MGFVGNLLTLPVLGAPRLTHWLARKIFEEAERHLFDEEAVRGELLELQERYDAGEVGEAAYDRQESALLERLNTIREAKAQRGRPA